MQDKKEKIENVENNNEINECMEKYFYLKQQEGIIKNDLDTLNKIIKDYAITNDIDKIEGRDYKASVSKREKVTWVEPILIEKLKKMGYSELVKTKEYVDIELLNSYIYTNQLKENKIKDCKNVSEIITLKISEVKNENKRD